MNITYVFVPKNNNLRHCSDSFSKALSESRQNSDKELAKIKFHFLSLFHPMKALYGLSILINSKKIELFIFSIEIHYLLLVSTLRILRSIFQYELYVNYIMHEPRYNERERTSQIKASLVYYYNLLFSRLSERIFVPSDEALVRAKSFVDDNKLFRVNLTFISRPETELKKDVSDLKKSWDDNRVFSWLGTGAKDRNPQGFISFVEEIEIAKPEKAKFIRAGRDVGIKVLYKNSISWFPGYMTDSAKQFLFRVTHIVVVPYSFSTQSGVVTEALRYGKLLVLSDIPAFSHFKDLDFVFMVNFNSRTSISSCIDKIFQINSDRYEQLFWQAVDYFNQYHSEVYLAKNLSLISSSI